METTRLSFITDALATVLLLLAARCGTYLSYGANALLRSFAAASRVPIGCKFHRRSMVLRIDVVS